MADFHVTLNHSADWENFPGDGEYYLQVLGYNVIVNESTVDGATRWSLVGNNNGTREHSPYTKGRSVAMAKRESAHALWKAITNS